MHIVLISYIWSTSISNSIFYFLFNFQLWDATSCVARARALKTHTRDSLIWKIGTFFIFVFRFDIIDRHCWNLHKFFLCRIMNNNEPGQSEFHHFVGIVFVFWLRLWKYFWNNIMKPTFLSLSPSTTSAVDELYCWWKQLFVVCGKTNLQVMAYWYMNESEW